MRYHDNVLVNERILAMLSEIIIATQTIDQTPWYSILADFGTILAGGAAFIALILDAYARVFGAKPSIAVYAKPEIIDNAACFFLVIENLGNAPAKIGHIDTSPSWKEIGLDAHAKPLEIARDHILLPSQKLAIKMNVDAIAQLLETFYKDKTNAGESYKLEVNLSYISTGRSLRERTIPISSSINLSSAYMSKFPISDVMPDNEVALAFVRELTNRST